MFGCTGKGSVAGHGKMMAALGEGKPAQAPGIPVEAIQTAIAAEAPEGSGTDDDDDDRFDPYCHNLLEQSLADVAANASAENAGAIEGPKMPTEPDAALPAPGDDVPIHAVPPKAVDRVARLEGREGGELRAQVGVPNAHARVPGAGDDAPLLRGEACAASNESAPL